MSDGDHLGGLRGVSGAKTRELFLNVGGVLPLLHQSDCQQEHAGKDTKKHVSLHSVKNKSNARANCNARADPFIPFYYRT